MTYEVVRPVSDEHLDYILTHLWPRGHEEFAGFGLSAEQAREKLKDFISRGTSGTLLADGVPVAMSGSFVDHSELVTWFQATEAFTEHAYEITSVLRDEIAGYDDSVRVYSQCVHPQAAKWFRVMGLRKDDWEGRTVTGKPLFRFRKD